MSGGSTQTTTSNTAPPPQFMQAYQDMLGRATGVANQPYQPYPGNTVAPFSPDQENAIGEIQGAQGIANPYINAAANYIGAATQPLTSNQPYVNGAEDSIAAMESLGNDMPGWMASSVNAATPYFNSAGSTPLYNGDITGDISKYENPFTQSVVNATQAQFNNQNEQQQNQLKGSAASAGAIGGDRLGVAQGVLAGQQQLAQAPVIAGLQSQGYTQAVQTAEQQQAAREQALAQQGQLQIGAGQGILGAGQALQGALQGNVAAQQAAAQGQAGLGQQQLGAEEANRWLNSQAAFGMGNLGQEALGSTLTGANALLGAGALEQQQAQAYLNVPYEQYLAQQAYPFQTTGWLSNIAEGMGGAAGGMSSTSTPGPSAMSQVGGTALGTLALLGGTGAFGKEGWLTGLLKRGGRVGYAGGGGLPYGDADPVGTGIPDLRVSIVPGANGLGAQGQHAQGPFGRSILAPSGQTTTSEGGPSTGSQIGSGLMTAGEIALMFNRGGSVDKGKGIVIPFPTHRIRRAPGGIVPQLPTHGVTVSANGIPQLPVGGGIVPGHSNIDDYLSQVKASAFHPPPPPVAPVASPAAQATSPTTAVAGLVSSGVQPSFTGQHWVMPTGAVVDPGSANGPQFVNGNWQWADGTPATFGPDASNTFMATAGSQARGGRLRRAGGGEILPDWAIYDEPDVAPLSMNGLADAMPLPGSGSLPPPAPTGMGGIGARLPPMGIGPAPTFGDAGSYVPSDAEFGMTAVQPANDLPVPPIPPSHGSGIVRPLPPAPVPPPEVAAGTGPAESVAPADDQDLPLPPVPPANGPADNATAQPSESNASTPQSDIAKELAKDRAQRGWLALAEAGFGMAAGRSPYALQNVGAGLMNAIKDYGNADKAAKQLAAHIDETREKMAETKDYHQTMASIAQQKADTGDTRAATYAQVAQARAAEMGAQAQAALARATRAAADHATPGDIEAHAIADLQKNQGLSYSDAYRQVHAAGSAKPHYAYVGTDADGNALVMNSATGEVAPTNTKINMKPGEAARVQQGQERVDQGGQRLGMQQDTAGTKQQSARDNQVNRMTQALIYNGTPPDKAKALAQQLVSGGGSQTAVPSSPPPLPKIGEVRQGYTFKGGNPADPNSWVQQ